MADSDREADLRSEFIDTAVKASCKDRRKMEIPLCSRQL